MENQDEILILTDKYVLFRDICDLPQDRFIELDLGFGKGGFTAAMAAAFPDRIILAADLRIGNLGNDAARLLQDKNYLLRVKFTDGADTVIIKGVGSFSRNM